MDFRSCDLRVFGGEDETVGVVGTGETDAREERVRDRGRVLRPDDVRPTDAVRDITGAEGIASTGGVGKGIVGGAVRGIVFERALVDEKRRF